MHDDFGFPGERESWPTQVAELDERLGRETLARALGVTRDEVELLKAGHDPGGDVLERLRALKELDGRFDLSDPDAVAQGLGAAATVQLFSRGKLFLVAFLLADLLFVGVAFAVFALR